MPLLHDSGSGILLSYFLAYVSDGPAYTLLMEDFCCVMSIPKEFEKVKHREPLHPTLPLYNHPA